jgi:hypothetical protein
MDRIYGDYLGEAYSRSLQSFVRHLPPTLKSIAQRRLDYCTLGGQGFSDMVKRTMDRVGARGVREDSGALDSDNEESKTGVKKEQEEPGTSVSSFVGTVFADFDVETEVEWLDDMDRLKRDYTDLERWRIEKIDLDILRMEGSFLQKAAEVAKQNAAQLPANPSSTDDNEPPSKRTKHTRHSRRDSAPNSNEDIKSPMKEEELDENTNENQRDSPSITTASTKDLRDALAMNDTLFRHFASDRNPDPKDRLDVDQVKRLRRRLLHLATLLPANEIAHPVVAPSTPSASTTPSLPTTLTQMTSMAHMTPMVQMGYGSPMMMYHGTPRSTAFHSPPLITHRPAMQNGGHHHGIQGVRFGYTPAGVPSTPTATMPTKISTTGAVSLSAAVAGGGGHTAGVYTTSIPQGTGKLTSTTSITASPSSPSVVSSMGTVKKVLTTKRDRK